MNFNNGFQHKPHAYGVMTSHLSRVTGFHACLTKSASQLTDQRQHYEFENRFHDEMRTNKQGECVTHR